MAPAAQPEDGVYVYDTAGHERVDALGGSRHDYPDETTVTVISTACGYDARWVALQERWDEFSNCVDDAGRVHLERLTTYHEFFRQRDRQEYECRGAEALPTGSRPGHQWTWECRSANTVATTVATYVGVTALTIEGAPVDADHIQYATEFTGAIRGSQHTERWLHREHGLELRNESSTDAALDGPLGDVNYVERVERQVLSLTPRR